MKKESTEAKMKHYFRLENKAYEIKVLVYPKI